MRIFIIPIITICALLISACNEKKHKSKLPVNKSVFQLNLKEAMKTPCELKLSYFIQKIEYIPLETTDSCLISEINGIKETEAFLYIENKGQILQFDKNGKFCRSLFNGGRGPGECFSRSFDIDEKTNQIYVYSNFRHKINVYSEKGNFLKSINDPNSQTFSTGKIFCINNLLICIPNIMNNIPNAFLKAFGLPDMKLKHEIKNRHNYIPSRRLVVVTSNIFSIQKEEKNILFKEKYNDTIYSTENFNQIKEKYILKLGNKKREFKEDMDINTMSSPIIPNSYIFERFHESKRYLLMNITKLTKKKNQEELIIYDKIEDLLFYSEELFIKNDIDGGIDFETFNTGNHWANGEKLIFAVQPVDLLEKDLENCFFTDSLQLQKLKQLQENIKIYDNPILMIVTLKK